MRIIDQLVYKISGDTSSFNTAIDKSSGSVNKFGNLAKKVFAGLGIGLSINTLARAVSNANKQFAEFETSLAKTSTLFGDVDVNMENLSQKVLQVSSATGVLSSTIGEALYSALSAGVEVTEDMAGALSLAEGSTKLAKAGFTDVDTALSTTIKTLNAYKLGVDESDRIQKILIQTQNKGIITVGQLGDSLAMVTPTAAAFGISFETVGAAIATMTAQGIQSRQSVTYLNQIISELGKQGTSASAGLMKATEAAGMGQKTFNELISEGFELNDILDIMYDYSSKNGLSMVDMFSSIEAGKGALALTGTNAQYFADSLNSMSTEADVVTDAYEKMMNTVQGQTDILRANISNLGIAVGKELAPATTSILTAINDSLESLTTNVPKMKLYFEFLGEAANITADEIKTGFENIKNRVDEILTSFGIGELDLAVLFKPIGDFYKDLKTALETGDWSNIWGSFAGAWKRGAVLAISLAMGANAVGSALSAIKLGLGLGSSTFGVAGAIGGLSIAVALMEAQENGNYEKFGENLAAALAVGLGVGVLTKSSRAGALAFTLVMNLEVGSNIANLVKDMVNEYKGSDPEKLEIQAIINAPEGFFTEYGAFGAAQKKLAKVAGTELGAEMLAGIGVGLNEIDDLGEQKARQLLESLKDGLEIHSPSKKGETEIGQPLAEGIVKGATDQTYGERLSEAWQNIVVTGLKKLEDDAKDAGEDVGETIVESIEDEVENTSFLTTIKGWLDTAKEFLNEYQDEINNTATGLNQIASAWGYINQVQANVHQEELNRLQEENNATIKAMIEEGATAEEIADKRTELDDDYNELKKEYAIEDMKRKKATGTFQAIIDTASAILGFLVDPGGLAGLGLSALAGVTGATQIAAINSTPLPSFDVGSIRIPETTQATVHKDEMILTAPQAEQARREGITIAPNKASGNSVNLVIYLDGKEIARNTIDNLNSGSVGTIKARVVK